MRPHYPYCRACRLLPFGSEKHSYERTIRHTDAICNSSANNSQTVQTNKVVSSNASKVTIVISGGLFNPQALTIKKGSTVTWVNKDYAIYTITADNLGPTSQALKYNGTYSYKFNIAGIYGYHLASNPKAEGTVIVK